MNLSINRGRVRKLLDEQAEAGLPTTRFTTKFPESMQPDDGLNRTAR
jgi:hypothetical protein